MIRGAAIAAIVGALTVATARADTSYRWQVMVSDGLSDAALASMVNETVTKPTRGWIAYAGGAGILLGGPIIHAAHGDWGAAGISLGTRVVLPLGAGLTAGWICDSRPRRRNEWFPCLGAFLVATGLGVIGAEVIDWTLLPHTDASPAPLVFRLGGAF